MGDPARGLKQWFSDVREHQTHLQGLLKHTPLHPIPGVADSVCLGWGLMICISNKFQVKLLVLVFWGPHFENH